MGGSEEDDDSEQKGFQVRVDLRFGDMRSVSVRERERERKRERERGNKHNLEQIDRKERVCMKRMHEHVTC